MSITLFVLQFISIIAALVGGFTALLQYIKQNKRKRADLLSEIVNKMRSDPDIRAVISSIEKGSFKYGESFYHYLDEDEAKTDKTLEYLSFFCYMKNSHLIGEKEFSFVEYEIRVVVSNREIQKYLYNLYHYAKSDVFSKQEEKNKDVNNGGKNNLHDSAVKIPFDNLLKFAEREGLINKSFYDLPGPFEYIL